VARALGERLYGVRIDTSETLVDKSVIPQMGTFKPTGVNPQLVWERAPGARRGGIRAREDRRLGWVYVEKIRQFEEQQVPVEHVRRGSSLFQGRFDFTADVVRVEGSRWRRWAGATANPRLKRVE